MGHIDWTKIQKRYAGKWVALASDEKTVVSSGSTAAIALKKARREGVADPILSKMPKKVVAYIGRA